jgi:RNA polymerase sigma factor (sigma-70 family)
MIDANRNEDSFRLTRRLRRSSPHVLCCPEERAARRARVQGEGKKRRSYRPAVEPLEALCLLSNAAQPLPGIAAPHDLLTPTSPFDTPAPSLLSGTACETALDQTRLAGLLGQPSDGADAEAISSGIAQLDRYLSRAWYRAGVPAQVHDDCSQAVYMTLLQDLGRPQFDSLMAGIGHSGIRDVLSRETAEGPDFFRAVDTVKKRAQRARSLRPLETIEVVASPQEDETQWQRRGALREAIAHSLNPREAALIHATLNGETPAEIASRWGVAPKTVSNEKTRVIRKLRTVLGTDDPD